MIKFKDYLDKRLKNSPKIAEKFWEGYEEFKLGIILKEARLEEGLTQEELAQKLKTTKSVISRVENNAENIRLSTLQKFANALNKEIQVIIS